MSLNELQTYSHELGSNFPSQCGNLLVATQYLTPLKVIKKYLLPSQLILDWGCGEGHFSYLLAQENYRVHSYAFSTDDQLSFVQNKMQKKFHQEWRVVRSSNHGPTSLPFTDSTYDAVLSLGVLEHVRETHGNELASLKEIYRLLKPGGYFFCFHFPNRYSWIEFIARLLKRYHHPYVYRKAEIKNLIAMTPFFCEELGRYNLFPRRFLRHLPAHFASRRLNALIYQGLEKMFSIFNLFAQNYYFVLKKQ